MSEIEELRARLDDHEAAIRALTDGLAKLAEVIKRDTESRPEYIAGKLFDELFAGKKP